MIAQFILAGLALVLAWKGFHVLVAMGPRTAPIIKASWLAITGGAFGLSVSPVFGNVIPLLPIILVLAGYCGLELFNRRPSHHDRVPQ